MDRFSEDHFHDDNAARAYLEGLRWPDGPVCPHCGSIDRAYALKAKGTYRCAEPECRKNFSVTMNTPMERSHIALHKWLQGFHLMCSSKKGVSAHQLHRTLEITYRSAWFMAHRIRECMRSGGLAPLGGSGKIVEADETYYGKVEPAKRRTTTTHGKAFKAGGRRGPSNKRPIVALVERGGSVRTFHVPVANKENVLAIVTTNISAESRLHTDESGLYKGVKGFAAHETVTHSIGEYVRDDVHTNSAEGYFSIFKGGMRGIYQHCGEKHLHRYLAEYDFRYNHRSKLGIEDGGTDGACDQERNGQAPDVPATSLIRAGLTRTASKGRGGRFASASATRSQRSARSRRRRPQGRRALPLWLRAHDLA